MGICLAEELSTLNTTSVDATEECTKFQHLRALTADAKDFTEKRLNELAGVTGMLLCRVVFTVKVGARVVCTMSV